MARTKKKKIEEQVTEVDMVTASKVTRSLEDSEYNNYVAVTTKAKAKIQAHKDSAEAKEIAIAKFAKLGITESDLRAMGL